MGLLVVAGLAATIVTLAVMTDAALFRGRYIVTTSVPSAGGIRKGDPVQMRGVNIGRIIGFTISAEGVDMRLEIEGEYPIPKDSRVEVKASGLLGGMVADVIPGSSAAKAVWGDRLPGASGIGLFDKMDSLAGEADKVAVKVQGLLSDETLTRPRQTVVIYMGVSGIDKIGAGLVEHGLARDLPAALVKKATWPEQRVIEGTLGTLPRLASAAAAKAPSLLIVGEVVRLRRKLGWYRGESARAESRAAAEE